METEVRRVLFSVCMVFVLAVAGSGCTAGFIYTNVTMPLTIDMHDTPVGLKPPASVNSKKLQEPLTGVGLSVEWDSRALADAARKAGFETFYFADIHTISILGGLWEQKEVLLRGR